MFLSFSPCFTSPGLTHFAALVSGMILCQGRHTISRVIQAAGDLTGGKHHSAFYRFLAEGSWCADQVGQVLFTLLLPFLGEEILVAVERTAPLCFLSYGIAVVWYLHHGKPQEDVARAMAEAPWYRHKREPSFSDMLAALRRQLWASRFSDEAPLEPGSSRTLELPGWLLAS